jgi:hypothetical protein
MDLDALLTHPAFEGMRRIPQWVVWKPTPDPERPGKFKKRAVHRTGDYVVGAADRAHWSTIVQAVADAKALDATTGPRHGVGFSFTPDCGYWFLDLDGAYVNGGWSQFAVSALRHWFPGAAAEVSMSGTGLHLFGRGTVPAHDSRCADESSEFYTEGRFAAMTGIRAEGDCDVDHSTMLSWFVQTYFPKRGGEHYEVPDEGPCAGWKGPEDDDKLVAYARNAPPPKGNPFDEGASRETVTFSDLWDRNVHVLARAFPPDRLNSGAAFDHSRADYQLAGELAYFTGRHVARIERLMLRSGLRREKWAQRPKWLIDTIIEAASRRKSVLHVEPPPLTVDEVIDRLRDLATPSAILAAWVPLTLPLSPVERERVIQWVVPNVGAIGPQALKRELRNADAAAKRDRLAADVAAQAGDKVLIPYREEASTEAAAQIEAAIISKARPGEYLSFGGVLSHVTTKRLPDTHLIDKPDEAPPEVPQVEPLDSAAMLQRIEQAVVLHETTRDGLPRPIAVPDRIINYLIRKKAHAAPTINGLVTHPIVLGNGEILSSEGLHPASGFYLHGVEVPQVRPYSQHEAALALSRIRADFLEGFEFASPLDGDVALAGLLTGVQRRMLDAAPGLAVLASTQSSGKTTLARRIHVVLTGRDMPVSSFPVNDEAEVSKRLLSTLLRSPAAIVLDNIPDGFTFASGALAAAMTSSVFEQRVLGISRDASVPTTTLFMLTGNNLTLGNDEVTRWMVARLAPAGARPQERKFRHPDVVGHARAIRAQTLRDVVGIVAGYVHSGATCQMGGTRYPAWDRFVRQPLAWAGASDVAEVFRANADQSEPVKAHRALLWALGSLFGDNWFNATAVASATVMSDRPANTTLRTALESMKVLHVDKARSVSRALGAVDGRVGDVDGRELRLVKRLDTHTKVDIFRVERAA